MTIRSFSYFFILVGILNSATLPAANLEDPGFRLQEKWDNFVNDALGSDSKNNELARKIAVEYLFNYFLIFWASVDMAEDIIVARHQTMVTRCRRFFHREWVRAYQEDKKKCKARDSWLKPSDFWLELAVEAVDLEYNRRALDKSNFSREFIWGLAKNLYENQFTGNSNEAKLKAVLLSNDEDMMKVFNRLEKLRVYIKKKVKKNVYRQMRHKNIAPDEEMQVVLKATQIAVIDFLIASEREKIIKDLLSQVYQAAAAARILEDVDEEEIEDAEPSSMPSPRNTRKVTFSTVITVS